jgi:site-specific recombinase XerD
MKVKDLFNDFLVYLANKGMDPKTVREHERFLLGSLSHSISEKELSEVKLNDRAAVMHAGKAHGEYGPQRSVVTFRQLMKFAKGEGHQVPLEWRDIEVPQVPKKENQYLTAEELEVIRNNLDITTHAGLRTRALFEVLLDTGMRITEAISLNKEDIDWELKEAVITNAKTKDREKIYFTDRSLEWIKKYYDFRKDDLPFVFVSGRGRLLSVTSRNYIRAHLWNLGIKKHIKHHIFRKTFATVLIQGGADITAVGDLCRHKSPRTTLRYYAGVNKERSKEVHQKVLNKVLNNRVTADEYFDEAPSDVADKKEKKRLM